LSVIVVVLAVFVWFKNPETHWMAAAILVAALAVPLCNGIPTYPVRRPAFSFHLFSTVVQVGAPALSIATPVGREIV